VTLTLDYVGSSDSYFGDRVSDILGENNFSKGNLNTQQVMISADELVKSLDNNQIDPDGYLFYQMANDNYGKGSVSETNRIPVRLDRLKRESDFIHKKRELATLKESFGSNVSAAGLTEELSKLDAYAVSVETAYNLAKKALSVKRYASLINNLIGGTGEESKVFIAHAKKTPDGKIKLSFHGKTSTAGQTAAQSLINLANLSPEERAKFVKSQEKSPTGKTFTRGTADKPSGTPEFMKIPYVRLGDIVLAAMQNAGIRDDIKFIFGTFTPSALNMPGYNYITPHSEPIYDIPIALDYLVQFLYDNMIDPERTEYPFRLFFDQLLRAVTRLLNNLNQYRLRISFDYTLYMTQGDITTSDKDLYLLTRSDFKTVQDNLFNQIISSDEPVKSYYILFAQQVNRDLSGDRIADEKNGIYHYALGADRGLAKNFNFAKQTVPQFQAYNIEENIDPTNFPNALILPQDVSIDMVGNTIHKNGDLIFVDSRAALGQMANQILALGGYYRVVRSSNTISNRGYSTTVDAVFQHRMRKK